MCAVVYVLILDECQRMADQQRVAQMFAQSVGSRDERQIMTPDEVRAKLDADLVAPFTEPVPGTPYDIELLQALGLGSR